MITPAPDKLPPDTPQIYTASLDALEALAYVAKHDPHTLKIALRTLFITNPHEWAVLMGLVTEHVLEGTRA